jgi:hypothetical protein
MRPGRAGLAVATALLIVVAVAIVRPETFWDADGQDLADSLGGASNGAFALRGPCVKRDSSEWECPVDLDPGSHAFKTVQVQLGEDECWVARVPREHEELTGCIGFFDYMPL